MQTYHLYVGTAAAADDAVAVADTVVLELCIVSVALSHRRKSASI